MNFFGKNFSNIVSPDAVSRVAEVNLKQNLGFSSAFDERSNCRNQLPRVPKPICKGEKYDLNCEIVIFRHFDK